MASGVGFVESKVSNRSCRLRRAVRDRCNVVGQSLYNLALDTGSKVARLFHRILVHRKLSQPLYQFKRPSPPPLLLPYLRRRPPPLSPPIPPPAIIMASVVVAAATTIPLSSRT